MYPKFPLKMAIISVHVDVRRRRRGVVSGLKTQAGQFKFLKFVSLEVPPMGQTSGAGLSKLLLKKS